MKNVSKKEYDRIISKEKSRMYSEKKIKKVDTYKRVKKLQYIGDET